MSHRLHKTWIKVAAVVVGGFGPALSLASLPATREPARLALDILSWPVDGATTLADPDAQFLAAVSGGFLVGWGVLLWCLAAWVYDLAPEPVRKTVLASLLAWFCVDSAGSILSGNASNALFNVPVLLLAAGPLWRAAAPVSGQA